ncbi:hypothetical protein BDV29DRAFT_125301 [Aspergillus leporis]|uniref:Uncharacterized protein n=1 Tax=Aspergillus leporis TaxID=41062 RepID=A0A5N5X2M9_9EURO|nr:hypothetical protein BDV29DRAFT_125301 [Aspergillus leporis]
MKDSIRNLSAFSRVTHDFRHIAEKLRIETFYETEKYKSALDCGQDSARVGYSKEEAVGLSGTNHRTICKFGPTKVRTTNKYSMPLEGSLNRLQHSQNLASYYRSVETPNSLQERIY